MSRRRLRIGLAGAGWVSDHHLDAWATLNEHADVVAVADLDVAAARARAERFDIANLYDSVEALLSTTELDAIDIATPVETHAHICQLAAQHGLAILCQKPLARSVSEAQSLINEIGERVPFMVHENWRFRPHYRQIHTWLREGRIGQVRTATMSVLSSGLLPDANRALPALVRQPNLATLDRMLLMEVIIHHVDVLRFLIGPLSLHAATLGKNCEAIKGEDRAALYMTGASSEAVTLVGDFMAHGYPPSPFDRLELLGTTGSILLHQDQLRLTGNSEQTIPLDLAADYKASYRNAIAHFLDGLANHTPFETVPEDNLETLKIVEAAYLIGARSVRE
ncbi:MAG: Gfo/Idh/MocA family oxidoreductase [Gemmatimonadota bacterium]